MIVAFLESFQAGDIIEPPKLVHVTVKKKFKLIKSSEAELIQLVQKETKKIGLVILKLGVSRTYDNDAFMVIEVLDGAIWSSMHERLAAALEETSESRDPHFEGANYYPHVSWKVRNQMMFDPNQYFNTTNKLPCLYLIKRIHPTESRVMVMAELPLI